jgi:methylated-DNA-protein-cysteine methyltransferase-like protein
VPDEFRDRVLATVASVGPGQVVSYGDVAEEAGYPGAARAVGAVLASSTPADGIPWWRVVYADGRLAPGHERRQAKLLRAEGVEVATNRVVGARRGTGRGTKRGTRRGAVS